MTTDEAVALIEEYEEAAIALRANLTPETSGAYVAAYRELLQALRDRPAMDPSEHHG